MQPLLENLSVFPALLGPIPKCTESDGSQYLQPEIQSKKSGGEELNLPLPI